MKWSLIIDHIWVTANGWYSLWLCMVRLSGKNRLLCMVFHCTCLHSYDSTSTQTSETCILSFLPVQLGQELWMLGWVVRLHPHWSSNHDRLGLVTFVLNVRVGCKAPSSLSSNHDYLGLVTFVLNAVTFLDQGLIIDWLFVQPYTVRSWW